MKKTPLVFLQLLTPLMLFSQTVNIAVDVTQNRKEVSPFIYGKNNSLSDNPGNPVSIADWSRLKEAGIMLYRENGGNNATKYNWRLKLSSHPDWYNNVYDHDWDYAAQSLQQNIPGARGMFAFQLIGKAAKTKAFNFNDWAYNGSQWTEDASNNWAGGGGPVSVGGNGGDGDPDLYLTTWTADSTVGILDKWFGTLPGSLNLSQQSFQYWNMDNEPEIWMDTHDDVMPIQLPAEELMQRYFEVAKKARAKFPDIKLVGFVPCSEWYWYAYPDNEGNSGKITVGDNEYTWIEFFIKRIAEEQATSGVRLLDVIDLHTYLNVNSVEELLQAHRVFYDRTYAFPGANGVKLTSPDGWDNSIDQEFIFTRINEWLNQYLGEGHGVTLGSTESGWDTFNQMPLALNYASTLGTFANEGVELFTPWFWSPSYWEVVHLFSRYSKRISVQSLSGDNNYVSAYSTVNPSNDSLTIVLVNRYPTVKNVSVSLSGITVNNGLYQAFILDNLPNDNTTETFVSHTNNALKTSEAVVSGNSLSLSLSAYSITSVILSAGTESGNYLGVSPQEINLEEKADTVVLSVFSNVNWTASSDQTWLTINPTTGSGNGSISVSSTANPLTEARSAILTVSAPEVEDKTVTVTQAAVKIYPSQDLVIYSDNQTLIEATWTGAGTLSQVSLGAFEGTQHYRFSYNLSNWWSGFGLNLTNWGGAGTGLDFTGYESLKFACNLTGPATANLALFDADNVNATNDVTIEGISSTYTDFTLPLSSFQGMPLDDVGEIMVNINGNSSSGSGIFNIDFIRLGARKSIPNSLLLADSTLNSGETACFDAYDTLTVAGEENPVEFRNGSTANLIAGKIIRFLPGFYAHEGSSVHAHITADNSYCSQQPLSGSRIILPSETKSQKTTCPAGALNRPVSFPSYKPESNGIKIYPNPNRGKFFIEPNFSINDAFIDIYNILGQKVYCLKPVSSAIAVELPETVKGICFVRISSKEGLIVKKIMVH